LTENIYAHAAVSANDENDAASSKAGVKASKRKFLHAATTGLVAGVAVPLITGSASVFAAPRRSGKILIAYYSRTGTTREVANQIQRQTGGTLFELQTTHSYPKEYRATTNQAKKEQQAAFRPKLTAEVQDAASYDLVFIGFPNWWDTLPMAFFSFLEQYRFAGKTLIPFCTHEGSHFGSSLNDVRAICPNATLLEGLALRDGGIDKVQSDSAQRDVSDWLRKIGLLNG